MIGSIGYIPKLNKKELIRHTYEHSYMHQQVKMVGREVTYLNKIKKN